MNKKKFRKGNSYHIYITGIITEKGIYEPKKLNKLCESLELSQRWKVKKKRDNTR